MQHVSEAHEMSAGSPLVLWRRAWTKGVGTERVVAVGHSAGGHLATLSRRPEQASPARQVLVPHRVNRCDQP